MLLRHSASLLDIAQATAVGMQTLALWVSVAPGADPAWQDDVAAAAVQQQVCFAPRNEADFQRWAERDSSPRQIVTLMAREVTAEQVQRVCALMTELGMQIEAINRLSDLPGLGQPTSLSRACLEFTLTGGPSDLADVRGRFLALATELGIDLGVQQDSLWRRHRRLAVFDMDSTLIEAEVIDELAKAHGVGERVSAITERAMRGELDFRASFKERLALLKGLDVGVLDAIGASLRLTEGTEALFAELKRLGYKTAILSGGFTWFARQLQARLGIDYVFANELEVIDGQCTGVAIEPIVDAQRKADLLVELARKEGLTLEQTLAVGDGANDLPMLAIAGMGVAFRAKPLVRQSAQQAISTLGLDGVLYLLGVHDRDRGAP